ncbi:MAG: c-type cytochrome [bacterium]
MSLRAITPRWTVRSAVAAILLASPVLAQDSTAAKPPEQRSTLSGVFTAEQANRGRTSFLGWCKSCHAPESHVGPNFARLWVGKQLIDLFKYVSEAMPENDPGTLSPDVNADIVAYLLQLNGMPVGKTDLSAEAAALREIKVEAKTESKDPPKPNPR